MSSYTVTVLTPRSFSDADKERVIAFIHGLSDGAPENDFWICGQPFDFEFRELEDEETELVIQGWRPGGALQLGTYCGSKINHIMLGVLSSKLSRMFDGWIELGGALTRVTGNPAVLTYEGADGRVQTSLGTDVISPNLMDYWLGHDDFRLV
ncbi:hypothetical protein ASC95_14995 [Pelomonas sp. Root1217]|uniref:DUF6368 family protein n=1 Tax=Pelomonas sp. Root1217 TaxID=1736430 RepID=UPI00070E068F|nr:DUF6368 family protein [Pelomonas sp. Root1217]KQV50660.1 hypothetical protein ASC95_14995 [Pelomonas sp. Root1217]